MNQNEESDNTTYQTVNIHSDITHVQWGDLSPEIVGDVEWSIKKAIPSTLLFWQKYQVSCVDENGESGLYDVKEFFRVRFLVDTIYLLDYNRDMEQVFQGTPQDFDENGILFVSHQMIYSMKRTPMRLSWRLYRKEISGFIMGSRMS